MASKSIDIIISTVFKKLGIDAAITNLKAFGSITARNLTNIKSAFDMGAAAARKFVAAMSKGMEFERLTTQFKSLTGSLELAKAHMKDLQDLGRTPPFSLEEFAAASQMMLKMTGGMAGFKKEMEIVGDMAAATGNDIATVGRAFGLAYQVIRDGQDFGRAGQQLYSLGIMTKKQVAEFAELSKSATDNRAVWESLSEVFARYKGAMAETEKTTKGLVEAIQGEATVALTEMSSAISEAAKPQLEGLLSAIKKLNEDGTIEDWASTCVSAFSRVADGMRPVIDAFSAVAKPIWNTIKGGYESVAQGVGGAVGALMGGGSVKDAAKAGWSGYKQGWVDALDADGAGAADREARKDRVAKAKAKKRAEDSAKADAEAERRKAEDMARGQAETDRKRAEEKAKSDAEAAAKAIEAEAKAREKMEAELHAQRVQNLRDEIAERQKAANGQQNIAATAQTEFDKTFAWFRDKESAAAGIGEERAYAADYKRLGKEASRYGGKWRIDELASLMAAGDTQGQAATLEEWRKNKSFTPEVEAMVRASAADKTRTTAEDELRKITANTANLDRKLDELLAMKG